jgi:hypothetical protein
MQTPLQWSAPPMALLLRDTAGVKYYDKRPLNIHRPMLASYILWAFVMQEQEIVDVCLERVLTSEEWAQVKKAVMVAMWCTQDSSRLRPTMVTVVQMLEGVVEVKDPPLQRYEGFFSWSVSRVLWICLHPLCKLVAGTTAESAIQ